MVFEFQNDRQSRDEITQKKSVDDDPNSGHIQRFQRDGIFNKKFGIFPNFDILWSKKDSSFEKRLHSAIGISIELLMYIRFRKSYKELHL